MSDGPVLLDTNVVVRHLRDPQTVATDLASYAELYLPLPALAELYYGAVRSTRSAAHLAQINRFLEAVDVLTPDLQTAEHYGRVAAALAQKGTPIPQNDVWIAALALQHGLPLWTFDEHFVHVAGLTRAIH